MYRRVGRGLFLSAVMLMLPAVVYGQASIAGVVRDPSGGVLPGVTVEASSAALIEKVRTVVTDGTGQYRIVDLRPGLYKVTFALPGFRTVERDGIELTGTFTATVNAELTVGSLEERVTVTGESPVVDVQNVRQQRVVSNEVIDSIPSSRTPLGLAVLVPGVTNSSQDTGGTNSIGLMTATIHGGRPADYRVTVDGFGIGNSYNQYSAMSPNMGSTQEMTVDAAGASAEQGPGGVILNVVPKEGGNRFSGSLFVSGSTEGLQGDNFTQRVRDLGLARVFSVKSNYDINPSFGGPIRRDKLWFYVSGRTFGYENYVGGMFYNANAGNPNAWTYVADTSRPAYNISTQRGGNGRATWQASPKNKISVYYDHQVRCVCLQTSALVSPEAASEYWYPTSYLGSVTWTFPATSRLLLQAGAAARREVYEYVQRERHVAPLLDLIPVLDQFNGVAFHAPMISAQGMFVHGEQSIPKVRASATYVGGGHELKTGFENQWMSYDDLRADNNFSLSYGFNNGVPVSLQQRATPFEIHQRSPLDLGLYVQDKWTVDRLTVNGGLRFEWYKTDFPAHHFGPSPVIPDRNFTVPGGDWYNVKDLVPRMGASYDLFGNGKTAIKASANKYLTSISGNLFIAGNPTQVLADSATRAWNDRLYPGGDPRSGNFIPDCDLTSASANGECGALSNSRFGRQVPSTTVDPDTYRGFSKRGYSWEFSAALQHELVPRVSVDVGYFRRIYGNLLVTDNRALAPSDYDVFSITAPRDPRLPGGGGNVITGVYDLNPSKTIGGTPVDNFQTFASNYGDQYEHWNGVDVNVNARLPHGVLLLGGFSTGRTTTDNCDVVTKLDSPSQANLAVGTALLPLQYCHIQTNFLTQVKTLASYTIPRVDVRLAATFQSIPGPQILGNYNVSTAEAAATLGRPLSANQALVTVNIVPPGTMYGERLNQLDLRFGKLIKVGRTRITANLDLYNALNSDTIITQSNSYGNWQQAFSVINARFVKIGAQIDF